MLVRTRIKVFFVDAAEKPVTIYHHLRLFPVNVSAADTDPERLREDAVVHEHYDEIVRCRQCCWCRALPLLCARRYVAERTTDLTRF